MILITGASKGLGLAIAKILCRKYYLILHATTAESFTETIPNSELLYADFSDPEQLTNFCKHIKSNYKNNLFAVINNAGLTFDGSLIYQLEKNIDKMLMVNLKAPIMICKAAFKIFNNNNEGIIINISSVVGETGNAFQAVYSATKAGLMALSKSLAQEAAALSQEHHIRVLSVSPGLLETDMTKLLSADIRNGYKQKIPSGRFGTVQEVAEVICFLLSDKASYINGTNININGGIS